MSMIGFVIVLLFTTMIFWLNAVNPRRGLQAIVFLLPWALLTVDVGLLVSASQIALVAFISRMFVRSLYPGWQPARIAAGGFLAAFALYAVILSIIQIPFLPNIALDVSGARAPLPRAIASIVMFLLTISPAVVVAWGIRSGRDVVDLARTYIVSVLILAVIGWFQIAIWYGTGVNPLPITVVDTLMGAPVEARQGAFEFDNLAIYRMNSLAGEPKGMGRAAVYAMMVLQAIGATTSVIPRWKLLGIWLFLAATTIATMSTSAFLIWIIGTALQFPTAALFGIRWRVSFARILVMLSFVAIPVTLAMTALQASGIPVVDLLAARTIERIDSNGAIEDFDLAIIDFLKDNPALALTGVGLGNVHLHATRYMGVEFQHYATGKIFVAKTQYLRLISETGIIGLLLFLTWFLVLLIDTAVAVRRESAAAFVPIIPIATMTLVVFMAAGGLADEFYVLVGIMSAVVWMGRGARSGRIANRDTSLIVKIVVT